MRINKYLATAGVASRRGAEELVLAGRVKVNGKIVKELSTDIRLDNDTVWLDGNQIKPISKHVYLMLNKPKGVICSNSDEKDRKTVFDLLGDYYDDTRLFCVGRLDYDTEGLLLLTTDGDMANKLMHPTFEISKTYVVKLEGEVTEAELNKIRQGVVLDGQKTNKCRARLLAYNDTNKISRLEVVITEGRNRQVRRMFETINRDVIFLKRVAVGDIKLGGLYRSEYRDLKPTEIEFLKKL